METVRIGRADGAVDGTFMLRNVFSCSFWPRPLTFVPVAESTHVEEGFGSA